MKKEKFNTLFLKPVPRFEPVDGYSIGKMRGFDWFLHEDNGFFVLGVTLSGYHKGKYVRRLLSGKPCEYCQSVDEAALNAPEEIEYTIRAIGLEKFTERVQSGIDFVRDELRLISGGVAG